MSYATVYPLLKRASLAAFVVLSVAACQSPPAGPPEYGERYSVTPVLTNYVLATEFEPGTGKMLYEHQGRLQRFVKQYNRRGRSHFVIATTRDSAGDDAQRHMVEFQKRLEREGIDPRRIDVRPGAAPLGNDHSVVLSFRGYEAGVPDCGDWTGASGFNPGNLPHTNFGCSYQRNIGLMLSDPGELLQAQDADQMDSNRSSLFVNGFRQGEESEEEAESLSGL